MSGLAVKLPPHPGAAHMNALELAYDGPIPASARYEAALADGRAHDEWVKATQLALVRHALVEAYDALKADGDDAYLRRAAAAGIVKAVLSQPDFQREAA